MMHKIGDLMLETISKVFSYLTVKQFDHFLTGASTKKCIMYLTLFISPPTSISPSRPPSEPITSVRCVVDSCLWRVWGDNVQFPLNEITPTESRHCWLHDQERVQCNDCTTVMMGLIAMLISWVHLCRWYGSLSGEERTNVHDGKVGRRVIIHPSGTFTLQSWRGISWEELRRHQKSLFYS